MARALALGIVCAPFISCVLLGLGRAGRALTHHLRSTVTPADELRTAATKLRDIAPDIHGHLAGLPDPVADWLDTEAQRLDATTHPGWQKTASPHAVAIARTIINGRTS